MADIPKPDYAQIVKDAGIPNDAESVRKLLKAEMQKEGCEINNDSRFSPFWRLMEGAVITCTLWLINTLLVTFIMPNMFLATAKGKYLDLLAWACRVLRKEASKAKGKVLFQRAAVKGPALIIPKDTWIQTEAINGKIYRVKVLADTTMEENDTTVAVCVEAEHAGAGYNLGGGYFHVLPVVISGIAAATNEDDWLVENGADEESDDDLRLRVRNQWSAVAKWHIDAAYRSLLMEKAGIQDDNIYFEHNAPRGPGTANALILLDTGEPSADMITMLNQHIKDNGQHGHGDDLLVMAMPSTQHAISVKVWPKVALTPDERAALAISVENFIRAAFRENSDFPATRTTPIGRFSFSRLGQELHAQFAGIDSLEFEQSDIESNLTIPRLSSLTVAMQG
ncbi:baseplate J/gp47 family protein [Enterovibrio sp. ZSDZ42]|uniref:Baseplate J/gp47 family protein n=1 Tax=Enterovibrio gelatinilyticus TaxID=2899819 RepID=A0ABT5QWW8_9GAMM|nr:baseplate J/gp47 family protein [Enterovibrio sp. ZSDZ42]MDD1792513.1 baseplate J/gp47 family protein [Enterovibrio sp. ZSDZ42]